MRLKLLLTKYLWIALVILMIPCGIYMVKQDTSGASESHETGQADSLLVEEIMVKNTSTYTEYGFRDYVELYNPTDTDINLSGIGISDYETQPRCIFPEGTYIKAKERVLLPLSTEAVPFGLASGESFCLFDTDGSLIFSLEIPVIPKNSVLVRQEDGSYAVSDAPTPGYTNDQAGREAYLAAAAGSPDLEISEICSNNLTLLEGGDWVEITNVSGESINLEGVGISDSTKDLFRLTLGNISLGPGECLAVSLDFGIKEGETLYLTQSDGKSIDSLKVLEASPDQTQGRDGILESPSPGYPNTDEGEKAFANSRTRGLIISEAMSLNKSYLKGPFGATHDYVEFTNMSDEAVELSEYTLSKSEKDTGVPIGQGLLEPGQTLVCFMERDGRNFLEGITVLEMGISRDGDCLILWHNGTAEDVLNVPALETDTAWGRSSAGVDGILAEPSPGKPNGEVL